MQVTKDGVCSGISDICGTCSKDNTECVLKKALSNYHDGGEIPIRLMIMDCPEYKRTENSDDEISWGDFDNRIHTTLNPNVTVRFNTGVTDSGT